MAISLALELGSKVSNEILAGTLAWAKVLGISELEVDSAWAGDAKNVLAQIKAAGLQVACVNSKLRLNGLSQDDFQREGIQAVHAGADLETRLLRVWGWDVSRGQSWQDAQMLVGKRLATIGSIARDQKPGFGVALGNGGSFMRARELWTVCQYTGEVKVGGSLAGKVGILWDVAVGVGQKEDPSLAVPTLNYRILAGRLGLGTLDQVAGSVKAEDEKAKAARSFLQRLRGIGFSGSVGVGAVPETLLGSEPTADIVEAMTQLKIWAGLMAPPKPVEVKPAAAAAAKPAATATAAATAKAGA